MQEPDLEKRLQKLRRWRIGPVASFLSCSPLLLEQVRRHGSLQVCVAGTEIAQLMMGQVIV